MLFLKSVLQIKRKNDKKNNKHNLKSIWQTAVVSDCFQLRPDLSFQREKYDACIGGGVQGSDALLR